MTVKRCAAAKMQYIRFSKFLHVYCDHRLVVVNYALEKDLSEEADVASYTKFFSNHLCKGNCSFAVFLSPGCFLADVLTKRLQQISKHARNNALNTLEMHVVG